jgi:Leucine Rich repeat
VDNPREDPAHAVPPDHLALQARELALFKRHAKTWIAPVRSAIRGWYWKRGFLDDIVAGPSFFAGSAELLHTHPVTEIRFEGLTPTAFDQLATAKLGTIRKLTVYGRQVTSRTARALTNPNLADLTHLRITYSEIGAEGLAALATSHLRSLRSLSISGTFGDAGLAALATSTSFDSLEALNFVDPDITDRGLVAFAGAAHFPRLAKVTIEVPTYSSTSPASLNWSRAGIRALAERFGDAGTETYYGKRIEM